MKTFERILIMITLMAAATATLTSCGFKKGSSVVASQSCDAQLKAEFATTFYPFVQTNCINCHVPNGQGQDAFAASDLSTAYAAFTIATPTKISQYAVDATHQPPFTGSQNATAMNTVVSNWNTVGSACGMAVNANGNTPPATAVTTVAKVMAATATVKTITWNLGTDLVAPATPFSGASVMLDVAVFTDASGGKDYTFSNPRLTTGATALHINDIQIKVNGSLYANGTTWITLDRYIAAGQTNRQLSSGATAMQQTPVASDTLALVIGTLAATTYNPPTLTQLNSSTGVFGAKCASCHGSSGGFAFNNYSQLTSNNNVIPFDFTDSLVVQRMLIPTGTANAMPPGGPQPTAADVQSVEQWIMDGAPNN